MHRTHGHGALLPAQQERTDLAATLSGAVAALKMTQVSLLLVSQQQAHGVLQDLLVNCNCSCIEYAACIADHAVPYSCWVQRGCNCKQLCCCGLLLILLLLLLLLLVLQLAGDVKALIASATIKQQEEPLTAAVARTLWRVHGWLLHVSALWLTCYTLQVVQLGRNTDKLACDRHGRHSSSVAWLACSICVVADAAAPAWLIASIYWMLPLLGCGTACASL
jgi:hypothetical protein